MPTYDRKGIVMYLITGGASPYTATELGRFYEGVDYPIPDFGQNNYYNVSALILAYPGAQRVSFLIWFQDAVSGNNVYMAPLNQVVVLSGAVGMSNIGGKLANWPADDVVKSGNQLFGVVSIADTAADQGRMSFPINS